MAYFLGFAVFRRFFCGRGCLVRRRRVLGLFAGHPVLSAVRILRNERTIISSHGRVMAMPPAAKPSHFPSSHQAN